MGDWDEHDELLDELKAAKEDIERLQGVIGKLRHAWFERHLASRAPEREWEDAATEAYRVSGNHALRAKYDEQTEALLRGGDVPLTPTCGYDMNTQ